jgi:hypothetical protein
MDVFISWSGERSKYVAECLHVWLKQVIQMVKPWMSSADILAGARWNAEISRHLSETKFGVICVTPENLVSAPWLTFEAGAIAKTIDDRTFVCPYLIGLDEIDPQHPLSQFQCKGTTEKDTYDMVRSMHSALLRNNKDVDLTSQEVKAAFDQWRPALEDKLKGIPAEPEWLKKAEQPDATNELLALTRGIARSVSELQAHIPQAYNFTTGAVGAPLSFGGGRAFVGGEWAIPSPLRLALPSRSHIILVCPNCGTSESTFEKRPARRKLEGDKAYHLTAVCSNCDFEFGLHVSPADETVQPCPESCPPQNNEGIGCPTMRDDLAPLDRTRTHSACQEAFSSQDHRLVYSQRPMTCHSTRDSRVESRVFDSERRDSPRGTRRMTAYPYKGIGRLLKSGFNSLRPYFERTSQTPSSVLILNRALRALCARRRLLSSAPLRFA